MARTESTMPERRISLLAGKVSDVELVLFGEQLVDTREADQSSRYCEYYSRDATGATLGGW